MTSVEDGRSYNQRVRHLRPHMYLDNRFEATSTEVVFVSIFPSAIMRMLTHDVHACNSKAQCGIPSTAAVRGTKGNISLADIRVNGMTTLKYVLKKQRGGRLDLSGT
jgi:hypothetical protein